jgi:polyisoprenoid-binding protein YceI
MGNTKAGFEMDTVFDRKDFNISWNQFFDKQGILISDQVKLHADVQLLKLS